MILVTGDLTYSASPEQFVLFDAFLEELFLCLKDAGQETDPLVIPVPGNHDLAWPDKKKLRNYRVLDNFGRDPSHQDIAVFRDELWQDRDASLLEPLFGSYTAWLEKSILPRLKGPSGVVVRRSHFPGDLSVFADLPDRPPLAVVGLNSAWIQYTSGDFDRQIELFTEQLHFALADGGGGSPLDALAERLSLLLIHHPPAWLSPKAYQRFNEEIYHPERFLICLHGHMHEGRSEAIAWSGGNFRYFFQAPSLFGLEHYGTSSESRTMGYALGSLDAEGTVRVWPFKRNQQGGRQVFIWDTEFRRDRTGYRIRPLANIPATAASTADITPWLGALLDRTGHIEISGIGSGVGRTKDASRYPIEQLYTKLRSLDAGRNSTGRSGSVAHLSTLLTEYPRLLIEGQPGAGKTTFLRLVATMLARDLLGIPRPDGPSWRQKYLKMEGKPLAPLFLRLSELAILLAETNNLESADDRRRILDLLTRTASASDSEDWRMHWERCLERGEVILLLDGLDEVPDERLRRRVFAIFRDAHRHWSKARMVVTSRPFGVEAVRKMGFHHAVIEEFGDEEVREFIQRWVAALHNLPIGERPEGSPGQKSDRIIQAVLGRPAMRRMAANPVMLTCLCVVHWNEGDLPEGRARLYRAVIHWLIAARNPQRKEAGFNDRFALEAFAALAFAMMVGPTGSKVAVLEFEAGAEAVLPLVNRHFPQDGRPICRSRDWLRFECLWSGIIEEQTACKSQFWHLTFQEYLAAQELAWRRDKEGAEIWWPVVGKRLDDLQWRETLDLLPGVLFDEGGSARVDLLLRRIIELRGKRPSLATDARTFGVMGRILEPMTTYQYKPPPEIEALHKKLQNRVLPIFERERAADVPVRMRINAAEALGRGGDPRLEGDNLIEVPISNKVSLGKYPVTVTEYQAFVDAGGYFDSKYWDEPSWRWREEERWTEPKKWDRQLEHPNWPVSGVSWYEARAYCRWRSTDSVGTFRLPTEAEWNAAATPDGREYSWGEQEPDVERANFANNVGGPTPVGVYPAGNGPFDHCDLAGNVWEWMDDAWKHAKGDIRQGCSVLLA